MSDPVFELKRELLAAAERQQGQAVPARKSRRRWLLRSDVQQDRHRRRRVVVLATAALLALGAASALAVHALLLDRGFVGLPPAGAVASVPVHGKAVLRANGRCTAEGDFCHVWAFKDGRLIWIRDANLPAYGANDRTTGLLEQRLTSRGVKLLRSAFVSTGECSSPRPRKSIDCFPYVPGPAPFPAIAHPGWEDATWGLPASAWKDSEVRAYVPARFAFCFVESYPVSTTRREWRKVGLARMLAMLPARAAPVLSGKRPLPPSWFAGDDPTCFALTTMEARRVAKLIDHARITQVKQPTFVLQYDIEAAPGVHEEIWFAPMLPNGEWVRSGGG